MIEKLVQAQSETSVPIIPVPHDFDIYPCLLKWKRELWTQHLDYEYGDTGRNGVEMVSDWDFPEIGGIEGTFLNHSEHKYHFWDKLKLVVEDCKKLDIKTMVFAADFGEFINACQLKPDLVAFEPPELIASPNTSVAKSKPDEIRAVAQIAQKSGIPLIIGAGVKDSEDVKKSLELGAVGVAVSSAVMLSEDPKKVVLELAKGFK